MILLSLQVDHSHDKIHLCESHLETEWSLGKQHNPTLHRFQEKSSKVFTLCKIANFKNDPYICMIALLLSDFLHWLLTGQDSIRNVIPRRCRNA